MKEFLRILARRMGLAVVSTGHAAAKYLANPPRGPFDEILLRVFPDLRGLAFIQIGANDGIRNDPIRRYVTNCEWNGVLVEPDPVLFAALQANYAPQAKRLSFLNAAIDRQPGERLLHQIAPSIPDLPEWARGVVSLDPAHVQRIAAHLGLPASAVAGRSVRTTTWDEVHSLFGRRQCDVLVIDAEGYDLVLLRLADLPAMKPTVIQFEHSAVPRGERLAFYGELLDLGYELATSEIDTIAYLAGRAPPGAPA